MAPDLIQFQSQPRGVPVPQEVKVEITEELIERATQRDSRHCMIAEAIQAMRPDYRNIMVDLATIRWTNPRTRRRYVCLTPERAAAALVAFDQGRPVEPFSVRLSPIQSTPTPERKPREGGGYETKAARGRKRVRIDGTVEGGRPIRPGHLQGGASVQAANRAAEHEQERPQPTGDESNIELSRTRYRQYGRRLLKA